MRSSTNNSIVETKDVKDIINIPVFDQIIEEEEVRTIVGTLVDNIYNDDSYQEYLTELKETDTEISLKKIKNIQQTFTDIKVFNNNDLPLFLASDIAIITGSSNVSYRIKNFNDTEKVTGMIMQKNKLVKKTFLTKNGIHRILFTDKTKLAEMFRGVVYKLTDHMVVNEIASVKNILTDYVNDNPDLVTASRQELEENYKKYKYLYELELKERAILEENAIENYKLIKNLETEKIEIESEQSYNEMYIKQLKVDKSKALDKIYNIEYDNSLDETNLALNTLKRKFLKEFTISLVKPLVVQEVFTSKKTIYDITAEEYILDRYIDDFDFVSNILETTNNINTEELFYLHIQLKQTGVKEEDTTYIMSEYIQDKIKFLELIETLKSECDYFQFPGSRKSSNNFIYKTTIDHIKTIAKDLIITII